MGLIKLKGVPFSDVPHGYVFYDVPTSAWWMRVTDKKAMILAPDVTGDNPITDIFEFEEKVGIIDRTFNVE